MMKITYDKETDTLSILLSTSRIKESDEVSPGMIIDYGYDDEVVGMEILEASKVVEETNEFHFCVAG
jgi:uncharacterized protein YuzE